MKQSYKIFKLVEMILKDIHVIECFRILTE